MHHKFDAFAVGVVVEGLDIKVGVGGCEVEHVVFLFAKPVFPADIPAFDKQLVHAVVGGKVDVAAYFLVVGKVAAIGFRFAVIECGKVEVFGIGVRPRCSAGNHLPPDAHKFCRVNPRCILDSAGVVEVIDDVCGKYVGRFVAGHYHAPGCAERSLDCRHVTVDTRGQGRGKGQRGGVEAQVHGREINQRGLVYVEIFARGCFEHQCSLHRRGKDGRRGIGHVPVFR